MGAFSSVLLLIGRILLGLIFLLSGIGKFLDPASTAAYMTAKGMTMVPFFLYAAAIIEVIGGLALIIGYKARFGAALLFLYLIPVTLLMHDFWNVSGADHTLQMIMFMKNLAIMGGLLYAANVGAGGCSCDACGCKDRSDREQQL